MHATERRRRQIGNNATCTQDTPTSCATETDATFSQTQANTPIMIIDRGGRRRSAGVILDVRNSIPPYPLLKKLSAIRSGRAPQISGTRTTLSPAFKPRSKMPKQRAPHRRAPSLPKLRLAPRAVKSARNVPFSPFPNYLTFTLHGFHKSRCRRAFEREGVANFSYDALLQRLDQVRTGVTACNFRSFQVHRGKLARPAQRFAV
jgi:hypothetical protein